jgi:hypothetical protein
LQHEMHRLSLLVLATALRVGSHFDDYGCSSSKCLCFAPAVLCLREIQISAGTAQLNGDDEPGRRLPDVPRRLGSSLPQSAYFAPGRSLWRQNNSGHSLVLWIAMLIDGSPAVLGSLTT